MVWSDGQIVFTEVVQNPPREIRFDAGAAARGEGVAAAASSRAPRQ